MAKKDRWSRLRQFVGVSKKVRLTRRRESRFSHNGFVISLGREWLLLYQFHDFYPEGYIALRVRDIARLRSGENERFWERMLAAERLLDAVNVAQDLPLDGTSQMLSALERRGENIIIECEDAESRIEGYFIGRILSVGDDAVCFANFDALGRWDESPHVIPFREITRVQFDTPYVRTFSKYLQGPCPRIGEGT